MMIRRDIQVWILQILNAEVFRMLLYIRKLFAGNLKQNAYFCRKEIC
jgi:hypothetical protein